MTMETIKEIKAVQRAEKFALVNGGLNALTAKYATKESASSPAKISQLNVEMMETASQGKDAIKIKFAARNVKRVKSAKNSI